MIEWIMIICTAGWGMCGTVYTHTYESEAACYKALDKLYVPNPDDIKYAICQKKESSSD